MKRVGARSNNMLARGLRNLGSSLDGAIGKMFSQGNARAGRTRYPVKNSMRVGIPVRRGGK